MQYDFIIGDKILLEVHGDYWHANPKKYENKKLNDTQLYKIKRDEEKRILWLIIILNIMLYENQIYMTDHI